ncbi:MAG: glycine/betaine ABC transporter substrate-binding protein [Thermaerobacter sp.]|nr:glycine/betaine ABC transporter substrate-binding protein [Thermaerobacter sp.]
MTFEPHRRLGILGTAAVLVSTMLLAVGCGSTTASSPNTGTIVIGSKNFTESEILSQMYADLIQADTKMNVQLKLDMGGTLVDFNALKSGQIDVYPDYTGTGYIEILKQPKPESEQAMYNYVQQQYQKKWGLEWLKPIGFNDTYAIAIPKSLAQKDNITTISDLKKYAPQLSAGIDAECQNRPDCLPGLVKDYGLKFKSVKTMDHSLVYEAMANNQIQVTDAYSTDGGLEKYHLQVLVDNKHFFPAYYAAPVIRMDFLKQHPEVATVLNKLSGKISDAEMEHLNYLVDISKESIQQVAHDFLVSKGLLKS